jgi:hypothetical protein
VGIRRVVALGSAAYLSGASVAIFRGAAVDGWPLGAEYCDDRATSSVAHADASARKVMPLWLAEGSASGAGSGDVPKDRVAGDDIACLGALPG